MGHLYCKCYQQAALICNGYTTDFNGIYDNSLTNTISSDLADALFNRGFRFIGRYLTNVEPDGRDKKMSPEEISILLNAGLYVFPIFQESVHNPVLPTDFNITRGVLDAYPWGFISHRNDEFIKLINTKYFENEYYKKLLPYICNRNG